MAEKPEPIPTGSEAIALGSFLKLAGAAGTGGEAKHMIQSGLVRVNGVPEPRRGHKVRAGDVVEVEGRGQFVVGS